MFSTVRDSNIAFPLTVGFRSRMSSNFVHDIDEEFESYAP